MPLRGRTPCAMLCAPRRRLRWACCAQAANDSPFLDNITPNASAVLCVLSLPARVLSHDFHAAPGALNDPEKYAIRAAVQVRAPQSVAM